MRTLSTLLIAATVLLCIAGCRESAARQDAGLILSGYSQVKGPFLYCERCGKIPSPEGSKCPVNNHSHDFRKAAGAKFVVCDRCGAAPSPKGSLCPVYNHSHDFTEY